VAQPGEKRPQATFDERPHLMSGHRPQAWIWARGALERFPLSIAQASFRLNRRAARLHAVKSAPSFIGYWGE